MICIFSTLFPALQRKTGLDINIISTLAYHSENFTRSGLSFDKISLTSSMLCLSEFSTLSSSLSPCAVDDVIRLCEISK